jgi:hypothetical protein
MTPSPDVILRDRIFLLTVWVILVVVAAASVGLCLARNDAAFLGIYQANTACVFAFVLAYMWRSIYQVRNFSSWMASLLRYVFITYIMRCFFISRRSIPI